VSDEEAIPSSSSAARIRSGVPVQQTRSPANGRATPRAARRRGAISLGADSVRGAASWQREAARRLQPLLRRSPSLVWKKTSNNCPVGEWADRSVARVDRDQTNVGMEGRRRDGVVTRVAYTPQVHWGPKAESNHKMLCFGDGYFLEPSLFRSH
jgi:hypothetical protein